RDFHVTGVQTCALPISASRRRRLAYRLVRDPFVLFLLAPLFVFMVKHRFASAKANRRRRRSVWFTNAAVFGMVVGLAWIFGLARSEERRVGKGWRHRWA